MFEFIPVNLLFDDPLLSNKNRIKNVTCKKHENEQKFLETREQGNSRNSTHHTAHNTSTRNGQQRPFFLTKKKENMEHYMYCNCTYLPT